MRIQVHYRTVHPDNIKTGLFSTTPAKSANPGTVGYSGPFVGDTSPKSIDREGLGESRTGTRQK